MNEKAPDSVQALVNQESLRLLDANKAAIALFLGKNPNEGNAFGAELIPPSYYDSANSLINAVDARALAERSIMNLRRELNCTLMRQEDRDDANLIYWEFHTILGSGFVTEYRKIDPADRELGASFWVTKEPTEAFKRLINEPFKPSSYKPTEAQATENEPVKASRLKRVAQAIGRFFSPFGPTPPTKF